jgi:hypothetical protein
MTAHAPPPEPGVATDTAQSDALELRAPLPDRLTLIAVSALAYIVAVALHEHLGHGGACVLLGSHLSEMGAFYVNCDDTRLTALSVRLVALAGPVISLVTGVLGLAVARRVPHSAPTGFYFSWLLGSLGLMLAAGYVLFSGISGIGDLGTGRDGALFEAKPEWVWRVALTILGGFAYWWAVQCAARAIAPRAAAQGTARIRCARLTALTSYLAGGAVSLAIGIFNPYGLVVVLTSAIASSMGGTSGLLWMMRFLQRYPAGVPAPRGLYFPRSWTWIGISAAIVIAYGVVLGPTIWS